MTRRWRGTVVMVERVPRKGSVITGRPMLEDALVVRAWLRRGVLSRVVLTMRDGPAMSVEMIVREVGEEFGSVVLRGERGTKATARP